MYNIDQIYRVKTLLAMSHFTHIKTRFQNLFYLEKALNRLNISHTAEQEKSVQNQNRL